MGEREWTPGHRAADRMIGIGLISEHQREGMATLVNVETAAPDMYEALDLQVRNCPMCKGTRKAIHAYDLITGKPEKRDCQWCAAGRAALAKARGEEADNG